MTVSLGIKHHHSGAYDVVPIATSDYFKRRWLPACAHLGLRYVSHFHDGALSTVSPDDLPDIVAELEILRAWAAANDAFMVERIDGVLRALHALDPTSCEVDFG
ncbi:hypothetical protein [Sorangium sp. So ce117]|uniref:hypothetical protein n=1 Tax=Sorangium sp. So ce117 TaxID=3133277 RepID=UPI003F60F4C3